VRSGFSPLDEELGLLPGRLSPRVREGVVRLATHLPFRQAAREGSWFLGVPLAEATVRRLTEAAGAAEVARQEAACAVLEQALPPSPVGPAVQQVSVDGAMVPLVGGDWAEVKTVAIGTVGGRRLRTDGTDDVQTTDWSYFSRLADAATFTRAALVELHRRGTFTAGQVLAPVDGSDWCQTFYDVHRPDAVRILDFPHAGEYGSAAARAVWGEGSTTTGCWVQQWLHQLKTGDPANALEALCLLPAAAAGDPGAAAVGQAKAVAYLAARWDQIQYAHFQAQGYPIGSGSVESANKVVVEARMKGSGMHWARANVNPLLALRNLACSDRWAADWPELEAARGRQRWAARRARCTARREQARTSTAAPPPAVPLVVAAPPRAPVPSPPVPTRSKTIVDGRPTAQHPWNRRPFRLLPDRHHLPRPAKL
jgi:hypothetical protein